MCFTKNEDKMSAQLLDGKSLAKEIKENLKNCAAELKAQHKKPISLNAIEIGENAASAVYIKSQKKAAELLGIEYKLHTLKADISQKELTDFIKTLNNDDKVTAIIIQMPLPKHINAKALSEHMDPKKDAEAMHPANLGKVLLGDYKIAPCTPQAVMELIKLSGVKLYGKETVIVGHSEIVGKPLSMLLLKEFATTSVCHIATGQRGSLPEYVGKAEILVVAVGKAGLIKGEWIKQGAIVIDVGINRVGDKLVGDVEFEEASKRASFITPVPGGVGPLTVTMLMKNVIEAYKVQNESEG